MPHVISHVEPHGKELIGTLWHVQSAHRLALSVASLLEPRGDQRYDRYRQTKKLYEIRSKAVHGGELNDDDIRQHVIQSRKLLSDLICHMLDARKVMSREEIERIILG